METATIPAREAATGAKTIADLLPLAAAKHAGKPAIMFKDPSGAWLERTYAEVGETVRKLSLGLQELGIERGDKVSILADTRPEWTYFDFAALAAGATVVPIYQSNSPEECEYVLENSDAKVVIVENASQLEKIRQVRERLPRLEQIILIEGEAGDAITMAEMLEKGDRRSDSDYVERYQSVSPTDICTFIYTSGTTGPPKGCVISHGNYRAMVDMVIDEGVLADDELTYLFLPLAHSFALLIQLVSFDVGGKLAYWERDAQKIIPNLAEVKPTYFPSVPRMFEKIYAMVTGQAGSGVKRAIFNRLVSVGLRVRRLEQEGKQPGLLLRKQYELADKRLFSQVRAAFGGRIRQAVTGAAPIAPEILRFFYASGVLVLEGWGMTETSTAATVSTREHHKFGTVGKPFPGCEIRIASDGEILARGPNIFQGYYKNEEATRETLDGGWLHTGDIGEIDADGYLKITGRKKDIIITAGGKNITPANIENGIKQSPWVSQCVVIGDRRPYLVALVTLDAEDVGRLASEHGLPGDTAALADNEQVRAQVQEQIDAVNDKLARVEQVKKFKILPADLSQEGGELTPTLKVKRNVVAEKYKEAIEGLYAG